MTSTRSPAFTASSLLAHFLLVRVGTMVTWYSTRISPSYWRRWRKRTRSEQQSAFCCRAQLRRASKMPQPVPDVTFRTESWFRIKTETNFKLFPELLLLLLHLLLLLWVHLCSLVHEPDTREAAAGNKTRLLTSRHGDDPGGRRSATCWVAEAAVEPASPRHRRSPPRWLLLDLGLKGQWVPHPRRSAPWNGWSVKVCRCCWHKTARL